MSFFKQHWRALLLAAALAVGALNIFGCGGKGDGAKGESGTFTDSRDGKVYKTVTIGRKNWMAENLNYKADNSFCYDNDESNCAKYGRFYDWNTAKTTCPTGWHLPSNQEWDDLAQAAGGKKANHDYDDGFDWQGAGEKLKAKNGWYNETSNGTDDFGFSALPGGMRTNDRSNGIGFYGIWWTATGGSSDTTAYQRSMTSYDAVMNDGQGNDESTDLAENIYTTGDSWLSVRCIQD